jgi:hypothetical protein
VHRSSSWLRDAPHGRKSLGHGGALLNGLKPWGAALDGRSLPLVVEQVQRVGALLPHERS